MKVDVDRTQTVTSRSFDSSFFFNRWFLKEVEKQIGKKNYRPPIGPVS